MFRFDRTLIDPSPDLLGRTLGEAAAAANKGFRSRRMPWPPEDFKAFLTRLRAEPSGQRQWAGQRGGPCVAVAWWSDRLGRKHFRIVAAGGSSGDLFHPDGPAEQEGIEISPGLLWKVYPDDLYFWDTSNSDEGRPGEKGDWCLWAVCRCGAAGRPEDLGWMGPWCTACHDRAEGGAPLTRPGDCRPVVFGGHPFWVDDLAFTPDGRTLLARPLSEASVWVWDALTGEAEVRKVPGRVRAIAASPDGQTAAMCEGVQVRLWSLVDGTERLTFPQPLADPGNDRAALAFSPDGTLLASATHPSSSSSRCQLSLRDSATGEVRWSITPEGRGPFHWGRHVLAFSPDGLTLALGWERPAVRLWDVASGQERAALACEMHDLTALAFSPDGLTLALGAEFWREDKLKLWDLAAGKEKVSLPGPVSGVAFSPDGLLLATAGRDGVLRLRNARDGRMLGAFRWQQGSLTTVVFSPDGQLLATGAQEDRVKLWPVPLLPGARPREGRQGKGGRKRKAR